MKTTEERFWDKVEKTDMCWTWKAGVNEWGYGKFNVPLGGPLRQRHVLAHRYAWELVRGPIPDGLVLMHSCDNPRCVNVKHLSLGTHGANHADMHAKGRAHISPSRKITVNGETLRLKEWAARLGVHPTAISHRLAKGWTEARAVTTPRGGR